MVKEITDTHVKIKSDLWFAVPVVALIGITLISATPRTALAQAAQLCQGLAITVDIGAGDIPTSGDDVILGTSGDDFIESGDGDDIVCGGAGDDTIYGDEGADIIYGQGGDDFLHGSCRTLPCGLEQEIDDNDELFGGIGNDQLTVSAGAVAHGGPGEDILIGDGVLYGGSDNDELYISERGNEAHGQSGDDVFLLEIFDAQFVSDEIAMLGGNGNDTFISGSLFSFDDTVDLQITMEGGSGDDEFFTGSTANHVVDGGAGDDRIFLTTGNLDVVRAGSGDDSVSVGPGILGDSQEPGVSPPVVIAFGNAGKDVLTCESGIECMFFGGPGDDAITGSDQNDFLSGNDGNDCLVGLGGDDLMRGHSGNDELNGGSGNDTVQGGKGDDLVLGENDSNDFIVAGNAGFDECDVDHPSCEMVTEISDFSCEAAAGGDL